MRRYGFAKGGAIRLSFAGMGVTLLCAVLLVGAAPARAGTWIQVSCVNPNGSAAPNDGWSGFAQGSPGAWSSNNSDCRPGSPMAATLSDLNPVPAGSGEYLEYQPPASSRLVGGTVDVNLGADGYENADSGSPGNAVARAAVYEPGLVNSPSDLFFQCVAWLAPCSSSTTDNVEYSGALSLPANHGGDLYLEAACANQTGSGTCDYHSGNGAWAYAQVVWANLLLLSDVSPQGTQFSGSALQKNARGLAHVVFTASDPGGPGVYAVTVAIDGRTVWSGTPNTNGGACVPVGSNSGSLMFDASQPCLTTEVVDAPVPTSGLPDGSHELAVKVIDAAQNSSTVLDQTITTSNPQTTPVPRSARAVHARFVISWSWSGKHTTLRWINVRKLPRTAHLSVSCAGRGCPRIKLRSEAARHAGKLLRGLGGKRFRAGDKLYMIITAPRRRPERIELQIRDGQLPQARLLKR